MENLVLERKEERVLIAAKDFDEAGPLSKEEKKQKLLSIIDTMTMDDEGFLTLMKYIPQLEKSQIFANTVWENPEKLIPALVGGTLKAGFPTEVLEILSELRMLHRTTDPQSSEQEKQTALEFLKEVVVKNLNLLFPESSEESRNKGNAATGIKLERLFVFIIEHIPSDEIKESLAEEVKVLSAQRRIVTDRLVQMLKLVEERIPLQEGQPADDELQYYLDALKYPSDGARQYPEIADYVQFLKTANALVLKEEAVNHGENMMNTGLVSNTHVVLLNYLCDNEPDLVPFCLALEGYGIVEWENHREFILMLVDRGITLDFPPSVYGLHSFLGRSLMSRDPVRNALTRLTNIKLHPEVKTQLRHKREHMHDDELTLLIAGVICILGTPLGIGQGNNPTCQSARGISMWSQHSPAKLMQMIILCATHNSLDVTYEGDFLESKTVLKGLTTSFDFNLDPVSIVLVPHLDKLYNAMMEKAALKHPYVDPHSSVNPEFYGSFIQNGFVAVYDNVFHAIKDFDRSVAIFYHSYHPDYNGGNPVVYPVPLGIFITTSQAEMLGFHAISLLRIDKDPKGEWRAYFLNPNDEGRQDWGQGVEPSVFGNGEEPGESSLPFHHLVSRVYAFHFNELTIKNKPLDLPEEITQKIEKLARESWGRKYNWI